jgi:cysteine-rich repeat protein
MKIGVGVSVLVVACLAVAGPAAAQTCGDSVRDAGEQCDDGNTRNLDACDSACKFEQSHRVNNLTLHRGTDPVLCTANAFGGSFTGNLLGNTAYDLVQTGIANAVTLGDTNILVHMTGLDDLTGSDDPAFETGVLSGTPILPGSTAYDGNADLDWWYETDTDPTMLDAQRVPLNRLTSSLAGGIVHAGPGAADVKLFLGGAVGKFHLSSLTLDVATDFSGPPTTASAHLPPGHVPYENVDPALESFATAGTVAAPGTMCGDLSALSLKQTPLPPNLQGAVCGQNYGPANSLLDVLVGACGQGPINAIRPTQPDRQDPAAPPAGAGPAYVLSASNPTTKIVDTCRDSTAAIVDLTACLTDAAYSIHFKFTSDRVIATLDHLFGDGFE